MPRHDPSRDYMSNVLAGALLGIVVLLVVLTRSHHTWGWDDTALVGVGVFAAAGAGALIELATRRKRRT